MAAAISKYNMTLEGIAPVYVKAEDMGEDFMTRFKDNFKISIVSEDEESIVFDMVGIDAPVANAIRRILLAEVPTMAIETVYIYKNTGIVQDEVLSHRLGLIPLRADPRKMQYLEDPDNPTDMDTLVFSLKAVGTRESAMTVGSSTGAGGAGAASVPPPGASIDQTTFLQAFTAEAGQEGDVEGKYTRVLASQMEWTPHGSQDVTFPRGAEEVGPVAGDILLAKLAPGQVIHLEAHAVKGTGKTHAKWSPVSTAWYRLLPQISLSTEEPFMNEDAEALVASCPVGVFDIEDMGAGDRKGVVARPRDCTLCRECIRKPEQSRRIKLEQVSDHFIFCVETTGALPPRDLVLMALDVLREKCTKVATAFESALASDGRGVMGPAEVARATIAAMRTEPDDLSAR